MKPFAELLAVLLIAGGAWPQTSTFSGGNLPTFYADLYGVVPDDSTNNCTALTNLLSAIPAASSGAGGYVQLPPGNYTLLSSCSLVIPANVIIVGCGTNGINTNDAPTPICGLHMTYSDPHGYHIQCLEKGVCGLKDLIVKDSATSNTFMLYTASVPWLDNVQFVGEKSAITYLVSGTCNDAGNKCGFSTLTCALNDTITLGSFNGGGTGASATVKCTGANAIANGTAITVTSPGSGYTYPPTSATGTCPGDTCSGMASLSTVLATPDNDGISFGVPLQTNCVHGTATGSDFCGYGANHIFGLYFQNIRTAISLNEDANGLDFYDVRGDFTDANITGYFVYLSSSSASHSTYGNTFRAVNIEQAPFQDTMHCNYTGAFGLNTNAVSNHISYGASDVGNCLHGTYISNTSSAWNDITQLDVPYQNGSPAVSDASDGAYGNGVYDMPNKTLYRQTYVGGKLVLSNGIDSPSKITGIPNVDAFGGIVGFSGTAAVPFTAGNYQLFSDSGMSSTQFTVFPLEAWLAQFTLNTSTANGTAPIQMQPAYSLGGSAQPSPIVFSIPDGAIAQSYPTNAPPFYVSSENLISFQGSTPTSSATYATVRGFSASIMGRPGGGLPTAASTVLGTYYNHTVGANQTYWTSFSQQMAWANNTNENLAYTVVPFTYAAQVLCVNTSTSQGGGSLTITLRQNGSNAGPAVTIPTGGAAGTWCDGSHSFTSSNIGDKLDLQLVNTYGSLSANIVSITLSMTPTSPATGMLIFGLGGRTLNSGQNNYFAPFGGSNWTTTSAFAQVALPRSVTIKNLHCYVTICPGGYQATFTVVKNGVAGALSVFASAPGCMAPRDISDVNAMDAMSFGPGDTIELVETQSGGTAPSASSCTAEHD